MKLAAWLHLALFRLVVLLVRAAGHLFIRIPFEAAVRLAATILAWLNIMWRLWLGIIAFGILAYVAAAALLKVSPATSNWRLVALLICLFWLVALFSAARFTVEYFSIRRVRQSQAFGEMRQGIRELRGSVKELRAGQRVMERTSRLAKGTPLEGAFRSNREDIAKAEQQARQAEAEAEARAAHEAYLESLPPDHDPFATQGSR